MYIYQIMSNNFGYIDIILLAMIAGFIILRLRNILGRKTGTEGKAYTEFSDKKYEDSNKTKKVEQEDASLSLIDEKKVFLKGAEIAYETIITAFAKGEKKRLDGLLTKKMSQSFDEAITQRDSNVKSELTFIGIKESQILKFEKIKNELFATVKFVSEIISVKKDKEMKIIEGNPDKIKTVTDNWKFTKNTLNKNPNWYLAEIISK